jgi:hypothetical protein
MKTIIFFSLLLSTTAFGQTPKTCTEVGAKEVVGIACCPNTKIDPNSGICVDAIVDQDLVVCKANSDCSNGMGCLSMRQEDQFASASSEQDFDAKDEISDILEDNDEDLELGATCTASVDCESGSCEKNKCVEKRVCRLADMEDEANDVGTGVECEPDLKKDVFGNCVSGDPASYPGLMTSVNLTSDKSCNFSSDEATRAKSMVSMKTLRALEWLFATAGAKDDEECLKLLPYVRDEIGRAFLAERKKILEDFSVAISKIEGDYRILLAASDKSDKKIMIHGGEIIESDLATRKSSGYDGMMLMYRRNLIFQAYEQAMMNLTTLIAAKIKTASTDMANWKDKSKKWTLNGKEISSSGYQCRGGNKKKIKKRWGTQFKVKGAAPENSRIAGRESIVSYLTLIDGTDSQTASSKVKNGPMGSQFKNYYLIDSLMPSSSFDKFGKGSKKRGKRHIDGTQGASYADLWNIYREGIIAHLKSLKSSQSSAIFEPEILALEQRNCLEALSDPTCSPTKAYIDELTDIGFAQSIAYSMHSKKTYKKFFPKTSTMRRKFFNKLETDTQNIIKYYEAMSTERTKQAACLERGLQNLTDHFLVNGGGVRTDTKLNNESGTLGTGESGKGTLSTSSPGQGSGASGVVGQGQGPDSRGDVTLLNQLPTGEDKTTGDRTSKIDSSLRNYYTPLIGSPLTRMGSSSVNDKLGNQSTSASAASASLGNLANAKVANGIRYKELIEQNKVAKGAGMDVDASGKLKKALRNIGASKSSSAAGSNGSGTDSDGKTTASSGYSSTSANGGKLEQLTGASPIGGTIDLQQGTMINPSGTPAAASGTPESGLSGISEASLGLGPEGAAGAAVGGTKDALSAADQARIEQGYERNKGEYVGSDADELFEKVSKAYVRNLDKILKKKKAID